MLTMIGGRDLERDLKKTKVTDWDALLGTKARITSLNLQIFRFVHFTFT